MFKNQDIRITIISLIFSLAFLIALPAVPIYVNSKLMKTDSTLGGYEIKLPSKKGEKVIDLKEFKKGSGVGESQELIFKLGGNASENNTNTLNEISKVFDSRLSTLGLSDFKIGINETQNIFVVIPEHEDSDRIGKVLSGSGKVMFRNVKTPEEWSRETFANFYLEKDRWQDTDITESDLIGFSYSVSPEGSPLLQIQFTTEGRKKFYENAGKNIGLPIAVYINEEDYPFLMPIISDNILENTNIDPAVNGTFSPQDVQDLNHMMDAPLPAQIEYTEKVILEPLLGRDFLSTYMISFLVGAFLICLYFFFKFQLYSFIFTGSLFISLVVFFALAKILSVPITPEFIAGLILLTVIVSNAGFHILSEIKDGFSQGKPFDISFYHIFGKEKDKISTPVIIIMLLTLVLSFFSSGTAKSLMTVAFVGTLSATLFYSFIFPSLLEAFGNNKK